MKKQKDYIQAITEKDIGNGYKCEVGITLEIISSCLARHTLYYLHEESTLERRYKPVRLIHIPTGFCIAQIAPFEVKDAVKLFESYHWYLIDNHTALRATSRKSNTTFTIYPKIRYTIKDTS